MIFITTLGFVTLMGFYGSWHCGAMCGPITMNLKKNSEFWIYQASRLISYLIMTAIVYFFAQAFLKSNIDLLRISASVLMGLTLVWMGYLNFKNGKPTPDFLTKILNQIPFQQQKLIFSKPILLGLMTGLFPCGWFYSFLLLTPQMKNIYQALLLMSVFWLTALPMLASFRGVVLKVIQESPQSYRRIASLVLVFAGLLSILGQWSWAFN